MASVCPYCDFEAEFFETSNDWYKCSECGKKCTTRNHPYARKLPADAVIVRKKQHQQIDDSSDTLLEIEEESDYYDDDDDNLDESVEMAMKISEADEKGISLEEHLNRNKKTKKRKERKMIDDFGDDIEVPRRRYEEHTEILLSVLRRFKVKKTFLDYIVDVSEKSTNGITPIELQQFLENYESGISKSKEIKLLIDSYKRELSEYQNDRDVLRSRSGNNSFFQRREYEQPEVVTMQDFLRMQREEQQRRMIQDQLDEKDYLLEESKEEIRRIRDEKKRIELDAKKKEEEYRLELREKEKKIEELKDRLFDSKIESIRVEANQNFQSDATKLLDKAIERGVGARALQHLEQVRTPNDSRVQQRSQRDIETDRLFNEVIAKQEAEKLRQQQTDEIPDEEVFDIQNYIEGE